MMNESELKSEIDVLLRGLRACEKQATAVAWMARAYKAMEQCLTYLEGRPAQIVRERLVFVPERPKLEIVQPVEFDAKLAQHRRRELQERSISQTVVYPEVFLHPGLKPLPKPWTREDTRRLERAARSREKPLIQRLGK